MWERIDADVTSVPISTAKPLPNQQHSTTLIRASKNSVSLMIQDRPTTNHIDLVTWLSFAAWQGSPKEQALRQIGGSHTKPILKYSKGQRVKDYTQRVKDDWDRFYELLQMISGKVASLMVPQVDSVLTKFHPAEREREQERWALMDDSPTKRTPADIGSLRFCKPEGGHLQCVS